MKILIIGGTGTIGSGIIKALRKDSNNIIDVVSRNKHEDFSGNLRHIQGDAKDYGFISGVVQAGVYDAIVDLMIWSEQEFLERMSLFMENTGHYIAASTSTVYWDTEKPITEETARIFDVCNDVELKNSHEYRIEKSRIEDNINESDYSNWTITRYSLTYGGKKIPLCVYPKEIWLYRALHGRTVLVAEEIMSKHVALTSGDEVGEKVKKIICNEKTYRQIINVVSDEQITWGDNLRICQNALSSSGMAMKVKYISVHDMAKYIDRYSLLYDRMFDRIWDNSKFNELCGWGGGTKIDVNEDLKDLIEKFIAAPNFSAIDPYVYYHAYMDRVCGERTPLNEFSSSKAKIRYFIARNVSYHHAEKILSIIKKILFPVRLLIKYRHERHNDSRNIK